MATGAIVARILTQYSDKGSKQAQKDIKKLGADFDKFAKKSFQAFGLATAAFAGFATKIGIDSIKAASDIEQQFGALDAVFGKNSKSLQDFSRSMVEYGLSTADAARYAALLGTQLNGLGLSEKDAIDRTKTLEVLAADLAATYGGTTADAVQALSSTFKGEYNPIERYGVSIKKSDINARVAAKGLSKLQGDLLKAAEAQTAFEMIIAKTTAAQGQAIREYDTVAAQLQRLNASYTNIKASLGLALLPVVQEFAAYLLSDVLPRVQDWVDLNKDKLAVGLRSAADFVKVLLERSMKFGQWVTDNTGKVKALAVIIGGMFVANKIAAFVVALKTITAAMAALRATAIGTAIATAFATAGVSVGTAAAALAAIGVTALVTKRYMDFNAKSTDKVTKATGKLTSSHVSSTKINKNFTNQLNKYNAATITTANNTKTLTAEQLKAIEVQKQLNAQFGVTTKETDPIQLEAARLNLIKQQQLGYQAVDAAAWALFQSQVKINYEAERYKDIQLVIADQKLDNAEIDMLAKKWSISREAVIAYIASVTGAGGILGLDSPGNVAAIGWKNALDAYNKYLAALGGKPEVTKPAAESKAAVSIASAATVGVGAEAAQKTYESMISQGYDTTAALSSARYAGMAEQYAAYQNRAVAPTSGPVVGFTPTAQYGSTAAMGTPFGQAGSVTVNVNAGSVIGSTDALVNTVREGILASQLSGKIIQLEALNL